MSNAFEKFIQENRDAFDTQDPSPLVGERIKQRIKKKPDSKRLIMPVPVIRWTAVAATVIGVIFMGRFLFQRADNSSNQTAVMQPSGEQVVVQENNRIENSENETLTKKEQSSSIPAADENLRAQKQQLVSQINNNESASERLSSVLVAAELQNTDKEIVDVLIKTMNTDPNSNVRVAALEALQKFSGEPYVKKQLINALALQKDPFVQIKLIQLLTKMRERSVISTLNKIIKDQSTIDVVKEHAVMGVSKLNL